MENLCGHTHLQVNTQGVPLPWDWILILQICQRSHGHGVSVEEHREEGINPEVHPALQRQQRRFALTFPSHFAHTATTEVSKKKTHKEMILGEKQNVFAINHMSLNTTTPKTSGNVSAGLQQYYDPTQVPMYIWMYIHSIRV